MKRALCLLVLVSSVARANVWETALGSDPNHDNYEKLMKEGDELSEAASSRSISRATVRKLVQQAASSYRAAAQAEPTAGEPMYRLGKLLHSFYFDCELLRAGSPLCSPDITLFDRAHAEEVVAAWDEFEKRAPLDPRLTIVGDEGFVLFERALLNTKLATKEHLLAASRDYEKILARSDTQPSELRNNSMANLAETYMMMDRLEEAIEMYRAALKESAEPDVGYGLAVALDRDARGGEAVDTVLAQGTDSRRAFWEKLRKGQTFYVPRGEEYYYLALIDEAYGETDEAIDYWREYIKSGAHPEFQPRAKQHIDALTASSKEHPRPSTRRDDFRDLLTP